MSKQRDDLLAWFEAIDLSGYPTEALQEAYDALVDFTSLEPCPHGVQTIRSGAPWCEQCGEYLEGCGVD